MSIKFQSFLDQMKQPGSLALLIIGENEATEFPFDLLKEKSSSLTFVAEGPEGEQVIRDKIPEPEVYRRDDPACFDHLKISSAGQGFSNVIVWDPDPEAVRMALGCAGVLGRVYILIPPSGPVKADLNSTINYKSLIVKGMRHEV